MNLLKIIILAIAMSLDAFALMTIEGSMLAKIDKKDLIPLGLIFGAWQSFVLYMSNKIIIYLVESRHLLMTPVVKNLFITFAGMIFIGLAIYMFYKASKSDNINEVRHESISKRTTIRYAIVTSLDALLVGVALGILGHSIRNLIIPVIIVSVLTVILGVYTGHMLGYEGRRKIYLIAGTMFCMIGIAVII